MFTSKFWSSKFSIHFYAHNRFIFSLTSTAAATFRQAVALIFDNIVHAESLPVGKVGFQSQLSRSTSVIDDVSRRLNQSLYELRVF